MVAMNNDYFIQQFENVEEKQWLPQMTEGRILGKFKYYNVSSPLFSDPNLFSQTQTATDELVAYQTKNRH
jgi:hypothetical protein